MLHSKKKKKKKCPGTTQSLTSKWVPFPRQRSKGWEKANKYYLNYQLVYLSGQRSSVKEGLQGARRTHLATPLLRFKCIPGTCPKVRCSAQKCLSRSAGKSTWDPFFLLDKKNSESHGFINMAVNIWQFMLHWDFQSQGTYFIVSRISASCIYSHFTSFLPLNVHH